MGARILLLFCAIAAPLPAANVSGKWLFTRAAPATAGSRQPAIVVTLNQVGNQLTGSLAPPRGNATGSPYHADVLGGKVEGDIVTFYVWTGLDKPVKDIYQGKIAGDQITFTVTADPAPPSGAGGAGSRSVVARRVP